MTDERLKAELLSWFNQQMDLSSAQVDIVDGFVFMLKKIGSQSNLRIVGSSTLHPRFWKAHYRAFGYRLRTKADQHAAKQMHEFYIRVALTDGFISFEEKKVSVTAKGIEYLSQQKEQQLEQILTHIW
ncbi:hypothetical protein [Alkalicoccobacillus plakortidis]|uniref:Uncharacterized protein n=1 Tax=Alkalicoccobacillus plakortidis TaxID=444060 RepID=A0ABT0XGG8_9BACI|nr:hypothetical protein [Alkalicoccobacillus plakortidis]MCM2674292.1 hypothetical protein [Alkalicoccobacillus plakortidis]